MVNVERTQITIGEETAQGVLKDSRTLERGDTAELTFVFIPGAGTAFEDGTTFADGTVFGSAETILAAYRAVRDRLKFSDAVVRRGRSLDGVPFVRERLPSRAPVDSQIVLVEPADGIQTLNPFWAAVVGGTDESSDGFGTRRLTLELFKLADGSRYDSRGDLEDDLASEVI